MPDASKQSLTAQAERQQLRRAAKGTGARRWQPLHPPASMEAKLRGVLVPLVEACEAQLMKAVASVLEEWPEPVRQDAEPTTRSIEEAINRAALAISEEVPLSLMSVEVQRIFLAADTQHREAMRRQFKRLYGVDLLEAQPDLRAVIAQSTEQSVALIKSIPEKYLGQVTEVLTGALQEGTQGPAVYKLMRERFNVARTRAETITKDQMGKFYSAATAERNQQLGVTRWRWRTMKDGRVRPAHVELEGKVFEYGKPPSEGLPGQPVLCRCFQEPLIEDIL